MKTETRTALAVVHDIAAAAIAWAAAFWLRLNLELPTSYHAVFWHSVVVVVPLQAAMFWFSGLYRGLWRYASLHDIRLILLTVGAAAFAVPFALVLLRFSHGVPRSVFLLDPLLLILMMGGSRLAYRAWKEGRLASLASLGGEPVLVLGAGQAADKLLRELRRNPKWRVVGLLDDDKLKRGRNMHGIPVLGRLDDVAAIAAQRSIRAAIVAMPGVSHNVRRRAVERATEAGLKVMTVPSFDDIAGGKVTIAQLRNVELDDLLGRDPVMLDDSSLRQMVSGNCVMVTGAGGSIGSELCRQIARFGPSRLVLCELSEFALYRIEQEFEALRPAFDVIALVADCKDAARIEAVMNQHRPALVLHAAAYKHVPLMEVDNAWEAVRNNVMGTAVCARAAAAAGVDKFVLVSTDKAVNPANVMGATKRVAEMLCQSLQRDADTRFVIVRFGNVLGSAGSVVPKFREQIAAGGPVTVTHREIRRYFMSIPEASQLVLQAGLMGQGGELFVLDMGEPVLIVDLARDLIRLSGFTEDEIRIEFTGLRPGEKLYEEPLADAEKTLLTPHPKLRIARAQPVDPLWLARLERWLAGARPRSDAEVRSGLHDLVPEYTVRTEATVVPFAAAPARVAPLKR